MNLKKSYKYDETTINAAKQLYLSYSILSDIIIKTGMTRSSLIYYIPKWREERERIRSEVIDALSDSKKELMFSIARSGLEVLNRSMIELSKSNRVLTPKEMTGISAIIDNLDKIGKLDEGQATEIIKEIKPANVIEMRKLLSNDPFLSIEEVSDAEIVNLIGDGSKP